MYTVTYFTKSDEFVTETLPNLIEAQDRYIQLVRSEETAAVGQPEKVQLYS